MVVALLYHFLNFGNERSEFLLYSLFDWRDLIRLIVSFSTVVSEFDLKLCKLTYLAFLMAIRRRLLAIFDFTGQFRGF